MSQPNDYEMGRRSTSTPSISGRSTLANSMPPTEFVQIKIRDQARDGLENIEQTLKRGLEARQVGRRLNEFEK